MPIQFTPAQQKVLDARDHNILVSAAAGSGKTAVLVERIVRLVSEGDHPLDIDRLLVVTFTRAAAAQMRERIGRELSARLSADPGNVHLQRQEVLLHNAQITTMDSFFTFLLRNYFSEIDLDPGFRQIDQTESRLLAADVMKDFLEEKYAEKDPAFLRCVSYFCPGPDDRGFEELIRQLCLKADSHPAPMDWLAERARDYDVPDEEALFSTPWMRSFVLRVTQILMESDRQYAAMLSLCEEPGGPQPAVPLLLDERERLFGGVRRCLAEAVQGSPEEKDLSPFVIRGLWEEICPALGQSFGRFPAMRGKKYSDIDPALRETVKNMRALERERINGLRTSIGGQSAEMILSLMKAAKEPMQTLSSLAMEYSRRFQAYKKERHLIDFVDLEHFALEILAERRPDGSYVSRRTAQALRSHYAEILIDEYQDSNTVQELLLQIISGEEEGRRNRFMVGDIKQSIYRFRLARPEIFMEKYDSYRPDDPLTERIELDQNFRSRGQVLDCVNALFMTIMRREVGGVTYNDDVSLKRGAIFPDETPDGTIDEMPGKTKGSWADINEDCCLDPYCAEFLLLETGSAGGDSSRQGTGNTVSGMAPPDGRLPEGGAPFSAQGSGMEEDSGEPADSFESAQDEEAGILSASAASYTDRQKEALLIAGRIREMVGKLPVREETTGKMRPARYGDIVVLLRTTKGWNEDLRAVFAREGIPCYAQSQTGYFAAREIRAVIQLLHVLDNPRQDIPLYGALRGYYGGFSQDEIAVIRLALPEGMLYDALRAAAAPGALPEPQLGERCRDFLQFISQWRRRVQSSPISEIVTGLLEETGYADYCAALPAGSQRTANLRMLKNQADAFTKTDYTGLFQFLRYLEGLGRVEIDYGEANTLDENADVVRIMSIHKSKGLEFPVCFVAGLSGGFSFRRHDASGQLLLDADWGAGIRFYDADLRIQCSTLRREEIAEKIRRDSMGEELRVLYVAMTRAKEKLILTASAGDLSGKLDRWRTQMAGLLHASSIGGEDGPGPGMSRRLSPYMIAEASCFAELIWKAALLTSGFPMRIRLLSEEDLEKQTAEEQADLFRVRKALQEMEGIPLDRQPDQEAVQALEDRAFYVYPHEELRELYAQTSVSELKHRAMASSFMAAMGETDGEGTESAAELFAEKLPVPYLPAFLRQEEPADGARRGTAFHRILELMDYSRYEELTQKKDPAVISTWIEGLVNAGKVSPEDAALVSVSAVGHFLCSSLARRMAAAAKAGQLFREQPFVMGCAADLLQEGLPRGETVTIQGIIDAFFMEDGHICLVDYKTDRVRTKEELTARYALQLSLYAQALERAYGLPVAEKIIYSTSMGEEIRL